MSTLTPRQLQAVQLIASGQSQRQAAKTVGVSPQTMNAWVQQPMFTEKVQALIGNAHQSTVTMLQGQRVRAMEVLSTLLDTAPPAVKLQAIRLVLEATNALPSLPASAQDAPPDQLRIALSDAHDLLNAEGIFSKEVDALRH